jgi:hydroxymethylbilane synthase
VKRVEEGQVDAAVLALAGLTRLGLAQGAIPLDPTIFVPAPAQGALAVETRADDKAVRSVVARLDDPAVRVAVEAERAAMVQLEGGCRVPLGIVCLSEAGARTLLLRVYAADGSRSLEARARVDDRDPVNSGIRAAKELLARGAGRLIRDETKAGRG